MVGSYAGGEQVAIPEFAMGAMENWGLVTYREVDLLIDEVWSRNECMGYLPIMGVWYGVLLSLLQVEGLILRY